MKIRWLRLDRPLRPTGIRGSSQLAAGGALAVGLQVRPALRRRPSLGSVAPALVGWASPRTYILSSPYSETTPAEDTP